MRVLGVELPVGPSAPAAAAEAPARAAARKQYAGKEVPAGMTRKAFKRLVKQERMEAEKEDFLEKRRIKRRLNRSKQHRGRALHPSRQVDSQVCVVIDCGFDDKMVDGERVSLAQQLTRCYSENRRATRPVRLVLSNFSGKLKERFENEMHATHKLWTNVTFLESDVHDFSSLQLPDPQAAPALTPPGRGESEAASDEASELAALPAAKSSTAPHRSEAPDGPLASPSPDPIPDSDSGLAAHEVVYLTGDAQDVLYELKPHGTYIVGGIVDKDRYKNLCLHKAQQLGVRTARLPIDEHIKVSGRKILTTNQAFELLLRWLELRDWKLAFESTIPARKQPNRPEPDAASP